MHPAIRLVVLNRRHVYGFPLHSGKRQCVEVVQHGPDLGGGWGFLGGPRDHGATVLVLERQGVGHGREQHRIPPQHRHPRPCLSGVIERPDQIRRGASAAARTVGQKFNVHRSPPPPSWGSASG